jgi:hypothetical protein
MGLIALVLSTFWLVPFLKDLDLTSGEKLGLLGASSDPLFVLFDLPSYYGEHTMSLVLATIPIILLLICSITGIYVSIKGKNDFWAFSFILTLIVLPRQYLLTYFDLPVHYYRYTAHIYALNILLATAGMIFIIKKLGKLKDVPQQIGKGLLAGIIIVALLISYVDKFNLSDNPRNYTQKYNFSEYPDYTDAQKILHYLGGLQIKNRVVVPSLPSLQETLGSPHFFATFLPLDYGIPVIPGLLAESAISTQFVLPTITALGSSLNWGNTALLGDINFSSQNLASMIERLGLYNVQYVVVTVDRAKLILNEVDKNLISLLINEGNFSVMEIKKFRPFIEATNYKPYLFVDEGGIKFIDFSKEWFKTPELFNMPVIYTEKALSSLPKTEIDQIGGYIVSMPKNTSISKREYDKWMNADKNVVFLNAEYSDVIGEKAAFIKDFDSANGREDLIKLLQQENHEKLEEKGVETKLKTDMSLSFNNVGGTLINYSYFPDWQSEDSEQNVYWATPTMMWIFGKGETFLKYK